MESRSYPWRGACPISVGSGWGDCGPSGWYGRPWTSGSSWRVSWPKVADPTPWSQAGTGDLNSNLFRGTFSHPRALGGVVALTMERVDTRGPGGAEPGVSQGAWIRYARPLFGRGALLFDFASRSAEREGLYDPPKATRSDWSLRTRWSLLPGLVGDLYYGSSSLKAEEPDTFEFGLESRTQLGGILAYDSERIRATGRIQRLSGEGLPGTTAHLEVQGTLGRFGGVAGETTWESWGDRSISRNRFRGWTAPVWGLSLFAETGSGEWGLPYLPPVIIPAVDSIPGGSEGPVPADTLPAVIPGPQVRGPERVQVRRPVPVEGSYPGRGPAEVRIRFPLPSRPSHGPVRCDPGRRVPGRFRSVGPDPHLPQGFLPGRVVAEVGPGRRCVDDPRGFDGRPGAPARGQDPLAIPPLAELSGESQLPRHLLSHGEPGGLVRPGGTGQGPHGGALHGGGRGGGVGEGATRMVPTMVPFYQSWFVRLQLRIVTVRAFIMWENFTIRQRNQDFPGRILPSTRSFYGVRWTLWN